ncbi:MAG: hypothetical protein J6O53_03575 [Eubacterium sp.]|nr:hypothetical protein [Eubacterium sp.]
MKYLDLNELVRAIAIEAECNLGNAEKFVNVQDEYFEKVGVNLSPEAEVEEFLEEIVIKDEEMMRYIIEVTGMSETFAKRLADAERSYMERNGFINPDGSLEPFLKGRGPQ